MRPRCSLRTRSSTPSERKKSCGKPSSTRLTSSPSALVQPQWGMSPQMQRFMKAQAAATGDDLGGLGGMGGMAATLELNPAHAAVRKQRAAASGD